MPDKTYLQRIAAKIGIRNMLKLMNLYPPYLGAGIRVAEVSDDARRITIELKRTLPTTNYVGTQFGGSIYSMCDPWFMLLLTTRLGDDAVVWDKAATVKFLRPGRTALRATFEISDERYDAVRLELDRVGKIEPVFIVNVLDAEGTLVATVEKVLHAHKPSMKPKRV